MRAREHVQRFLRDLEPATSSFTQEVQRPVVLYTDSGNGSRQALRRRIMQARPEGSA